VDEEVETACTDGVRITFGVEFLENLDDAELDFVMMHEIMHVVLQHCLRAGDRDWEAFNVACDIVVNSNILLENKMDLKSITLKKYGESMHVAPDGKEGYEYTA
jgi:predicted metal-dependent peptidase